MVEFEIKNYFTVALIKGDPALTRIESHRSLEYAHKAATRYRLDEGYSKENGGFVFVYAGIPAVFNGDTRQYSLPEGVATTNGSDVYKPKEPRG